MRAEVVAVADALAHAEVDRRADIDRVHPSHRSDAVNLVHYLALRRLDVRRLQRQLARLGLSSLGRCEPHVMATVGAVCRALDRGVGVTDLVDDRADFDAGRAALDRNTDALLGPRPRARVTRIMVTLPSEAADDPDLVRLLLVRGMDVARINGAHDDPDRWVRMAQHVRRATGAVGRPCRVSMDLPGPKLRTGPLAPGPSVLRFRPGRDLRGIAVTPTIVAFAGRGTPECGEGRVPVDDGWLRRRRPGDVIRFSDTRGSARTVTVVARSEHGATAELWNTAYVEDGTVLECEGDETVVGPIPAVRQFHVVGPGDVVVVTRSVEPVEPWNPGRPGAAVIGCTLEAVFGAVRVGQRVAFDDARISGIIEEVASDHFVVRVLAAGAKGSRLRAEKGINLPDTDLPVPMVADGDRAMLEVASAQADVVGLSFVRSPDDVDEVRRHLATIGGHDLGLLLKIETAAAFDRLPDILLRAMRARLVGVMIARGDLAVEAGYGRLAEIQEEILWVCEAARVPVVWATEVLDRLARSGKPSRAEITDAAMAQRAECVMLNKGPHVDEAIDVLDEILRRMAGHQRKKSALLSAVPSWC